jgi:hypothetical protein
MYLDYPAREAGGGTLRNQFRDTEIDMCLAKKSF